ncbi:hypothetical protein GRI40_06090 [Altererythrobacter aerius]|uniref:Cytochrome c domain-containing protein n=1 Tax=Tsuneonella aeria TaxID=1837929 RepID=A0A6I4TBA2_9SPHN|nr:c-type cytochrome [Tsuneonella aeria]MXO74789.1 hypothetical protein [Tsuneonella aeria]
MKTIAAFCVSGLLAGCQIASPEASVAGGLPVGSLKQNSPEWRGQKLAVNRCSDCHSVGYAETSPLPAAPSFSAIANTPDLSRVTLTAWMKNHRNYPEEMYFEIPAEHIDDLTAYILTLRRAD